MSDKQQVKTEEETMKLIEADGKWHSWKCRCGGLNRRSSGNCGRCSGMRESYSVPK